MSPGEEWNAGEDDSNRDNNDCRSYNEASSSPDPRHFSYVPDPLLWLQRLINDVRISMSSLILTRNPGTMCSGAPAGD